MGKSWMSQVLLPSVIGSLLTYALLPNGPFPPFHQLTLHSLDAPWELHNSCYGAFLRLLLQQTVEIPGAFQTPQC